MSEWIDVSVPVRSGMVHWPGDSEITLSRVKSIRQGHACNVSQIQMSVHTGTHMDAPLHFIENARSIEELPLDVTVGLARVIEILNPEAIHRSELQRHNIQPGERVLFKTANSHRYWEDDNFVEDFVYIAEDGARFLAEMKVRCVGVDYLSVGGYTRDSVETHVALLGAGIWVIEGLKLCDIPGGTYELVCLPLKLLGSDGAPARAILRPV